MSTPTIGDSGRPVHTPHYTDEGTSSPTASTGQRRSGFRGFAGRRPIAALLIMLFSIAYPLMFVLALIQHQVIPGRNLIERLPIDVDELAGLMFTLFALLPSAIYVTWAADGRDGLHKLLKRITRWRFGLGWWVFILTAIPVLTTISGLLLGDTFRPVNPVTFLLSQLLQLLIQLFLVNLWEETAWAGVMQTRLERRHNLLVAALITAVPFGFVHWPLVLLGDFSATSVAIALPAYILLGVLLRPLAGLTMRGARDSVLAFALMHSIFNRSNNTDGIVDNLLDGDANRLGILLVMVVLTITVALIMRGKLSPSYRRQLESEPAQRSAHHDGK